MSYSVHIGGNWSNLAMSFDRALHSLSMFAIANGYSWAKFICKLLCLSVVEVLRYARFFGIKRFLFHDEKNIFFCIIVGGIYHTLTVEAGGE